MNSMTAKEKTERLKPILGPDIYSWDVRLHDCPTMVWITRDGGGLYETDGLLYCSCIASRMGNDCSHLKAIRRWGNIELLLRVLHPKGE